MGKVLEYVKGIWRPSPKYNPNMTKDEIITLLKIWMDRMETTDPKELSKIQWEATQFSTSLRNQDSGRHGQYQMRLNMIISGAIEKRTGKKATIE